MPFILNFYYLNLVKILWKVSTTYSLMAASLDNITPFTVVLSKKFLPRALAILLKKKKLSVIKSLNQLK